MAILRAWKRALRAAGVRYRAPEQLRHTFASALLSRNAPLLYVQGQGGWRAATVLLRAYARWMPQDFGGLAGAPLERTETRPDATPAQPAPLSAAAEERGN
jgi:integrase